MSRKRWARAMLRAVVLVVGIAMIGCAHSPTVAPKDAALDLLDRAITAAGGREALAAAATLSWRGEATVFLPDRRIELAVDTEVVPFFSARSRTVRVGVAGDDPRTLIVMNGAAYMIRGDQPRVTLPESQLRHERQQYAVYGLLLWTKLLESGSRVARLPDDGEGHPGLHAEVPEAPAVDLYFDGAGRPLYLLDTVDAPDGNGRIAQRFDFEGEVVAGGVRWPRIIRIAQEGKPYFELRIEQFSVRPDVSLELQVD